MVTVENILNNYCSSWEKICGSICLMSCAHDMAKWMKFHLSGGLNESGNRIMLSETLKSTYKARNSITSLGISKYFSKPKVPHTTSEDNYALGWRNGHYRGTHLCCDVWLSDPLLNVDTAHIFFVRFQNIKYYVIQEPSSDIHR